MNRELSPYLLYLRIIVETEKYGMATLTFERKIDLEVPANELRDWHFAKGAFEKLTPPWEKAKLIEDPGALKDGAIAVIEVSIIGPIKQRWVAEHEITVDGFIDRQKEGPFVSWEHHHRFLSLDDSRSQLVDSIRYELPFGLVGRIFGGPFIRAKLDRLFRYRHEVTREALESK